MKGNKTVSFDFDSTLNLIRHDEKWGMVDDGPNLEMLKKLKQHKQNGDVVLIVTARTEKNEGYFNYGLEKGDPGYAGTVKEFVSVHNLPVDKIYFTNGQLKAKTLLDLGVELHYDDDDREVKACQDVGIDVIHIVDGEITDDNKSLQEYIDKEISLKWNFEPEYLERIKEWGGVSGEYEELASGAMGTAFRFGNKVLKITTDESEAKAAAKIRPLSHPNIYKVYKVGKLNKAYTSTGTHREEQQYPQPLYAIVTDYIPNKLDLATEGRIANTAKRMLSSIDFVGKARSQEFIKNWDMYSVGDCGKIFYDIYQAYDSKKLTVENYVDYLVNLAKTNKQLFLKSMFIYAMFEYYFGPLEANLFVEGMFKVGVERTIRNKAFEMYEIEFDDFAVNLMKFFEKGRGTYITFLDKIISAVSFLANNGIIFYDIHSNNILKRGNEPVIIDLGVSRTVGDGPIDVVEGKSLKELLLTNDDKLTEMATPRQSDLSKTYYHGTSDRLAGESIIKSGIEPPDLSFRSDNLKPVEGKIYITPDIKYAQIYAIGGDMAGNQNWSERYNKLSEDDDDRFGYLFVIDGKDLVDIQPDEDSIGEMINKKKPEWIHNLAKPILQKEWYEDEDEEGGDFSTTLYKAVMNGEYEAWATAGKIIVDKLSDSQKLTLIDNGAHIAHTGKIYPREAWRIDKADIYKLKRDASSFFEVAKKINNIGQITPMVKENKVKKKRLVEWLNKELDLERDFDNDYLQRIYKWGELSGEPVSLGKGAMGTAFKFGNKVLKITSDDSEAQAAANIVKINHPNIYKVYKVGKLKGQIEHQSLFAIVAEYIPGKLNGEEATCLIKTRNVFVFVNPDLKEFFQMWSKYSISDCISFLKKLNIALSIQNKKLNKEETDFSELRKEVILFFSKNRWVAIKSLTLYSVFSLTIGDISIKVLINELYQNDVQSFIGRSFVVGLSSEKAIKELQHVIPQLSIKGIYTVDKIFNAVAYLTTIGIYFQDFHYDNVLRRANGEPVLIDLGVSETENTVEIGMLENKSLRELLLYDE